MRFLRACLILSSAGLLILAGCRPEDEIKREEVTHPEREPVSMRIALAKRGSQIWFFKFSGPTELVKANEKDFEDFVRSMRFSGSNLTMAEPKHWTKDPADPLDKLRYAGYRFSARKRELEVAITKMNAKGFNLMQNVHRWQKQVNAPLTEDHDALDKLIGQPEKIAGQEVKWVKLEGLGVHSVSKPPAVAKHAVKSDLPFKFDVPGGWEQGMPRSGEMKDVYTVGEEDKSAEVTLTRFGKGGGGVVANVHRWKTQVGLARMDEKPDPKAIMNEVKEEKIAGTIFYYVDVTNPANPLAKNHALGVIIPRERDTWFIKMTGPLEVVQQHKKEFEAFFRSFQSADK